MVLITSSTVSAILSAGIISIFTFLLFLVGYVLQQQSVNSLREAIRQPVPLPPSSPKPVLATNFRTGVNEAEEVSINDGNDTEIDEQIAQFLSANGQTITVKSVPSTQQDRLAYILALSKPSDLCSAALFAQTLSLTKSSRDRLVLLYPSSWETSITPLHMAALTVMRSMHDNHPIIFHPVEFIKGWEAAAVHSHLLGELQRTPWEFDRMLYLKTPGMVVDVQQVKAALKTSSAKKVWTPMTGAVGDDPEMLLWERKRGLLMPRGEMRALAGRGRSDSEQVQDTEDSNGPWVERKAYVVFGTGEERDGESELLSRFEDGLRSVCKGKGLLPGEEDRVELR